MVLQEDTSDKLIFKTIVNDEFSTKHYADIIRTPGPKRSWADRVWHNYLPPKVGTFMWKLMKHAILVDARIVTKGVQLASKCMCCQVPSEESISHLFIHSDLVKAVWSCFGAIFRLPTMLQSIGHILQIWLPNIGDLSHFELCRGGTTAFIFWGI